MIRFLVALSAVVLLTGCSGSHRVKEDVEKDLGWIIEENPEGIPEEAYAGGQVFYGNGKNENSDDIFTVLENKIWGEE